MGGERVEYGRSRLDSKRTLPGVPVAPECIGRV